MALRAIVEDEYVPARIVLTLGILGGILTTIFFVLFRPNPPTTFDVFYFAATKSMSGEVVFHTGYGLWTYTPVSLLYFYPYAALFDFQTAALVHRVLSIVVALVYGVVLARFISRRARLSLIDEGLVVGFTMLSVYPVVNVVNGSFVGMFTAALGVGWVVLESDRDAGGVLWALASLVKGFPAFWGAYLLRVHRWRAIGMAIATGVGATLVGIGLFGLDAYVRFFSVAGSSRVRLDMFQNGASPDNEAMTPIRGLAQLFPNIDTVIWPPVLLVVVAGLTVWIFYRLSSETLTERATLLLATIIGVMFIMPTTQDMDSYLVYAPVLVLLYVESDTTVKLLYAAGTIFLSYNVGRDELAAVASVVGGNVAELALAVGNPLLAFAKMPMYGILLLYVGCLLKAWTDEERVVSTETAATSGPDSDGRSRQTVGGE